MSAVESISIASLLISLDLVFTLDGNNWLAIQGVLVILASYIEYLPIW